MKLAAKYCLIGVVICAVIFMVIRMTGRRKYTIEFIVPREYVGVIVVEEDRIVGVEPEVQGEDFFIYRVPASAKMLVKCVDLFTEYHFTLAKYDGGKKIATATSGGRGPDPQNPNEIAFRELGTLVKGLNRPQIIMCVGTLADFHRLRKELGFD